MKLTIGSRASALARWQAEWVKSRLAAAGHDVRIAFIRTTGDREPSAPLPSTRLREAEQRRSLASSGVKGLFIKEIEEALVAREVDLAVHSMKDVPTALPKGLIIGAVPEREDPRDVLAVGAGLKPAPTPSRGALAGLPPGARIGTSSLRRESQLRALRPDLIIVHMRGNVDTRLRKLDEGQVDGLVLAAAGLKRLGLEGRISRHFAVEEICPAVGQGALAIEIREDDLETAEAVRGLGHNPSGLAVRAERAALAALGGGCDLPFAAYAHAEADRLDLRGVVAAVDGSKVIRAEVSGPAGDPESLGARLAKDLEKQGASELLASGEKVRPE